MTKGALNFRSLRHPGGDKELLGKEAVIEKLERTTFEQARTIKELEAELKVLQREAEEEEQMGIFNVKAGRVETESNEARAMELEAVRARARQIGRENALKAELAGVEEMERRAEIEIEGEKHVRVLWEKLRKVKESQVKHKVEVREMETKMNKALEELRVDLVRFLPEESSDVLVRDLMWAF